MSLQVATCVDNNILVLYRSNMNMAAVGGNILLFNISTGVQTAKFIDDDATHVLLHELPTYSSIVIMHIL